MGEGERVGVRLCVSRGLPVPVRVALTEREGLRVWEGERVAEGLGDTVATEEAEPVGLAERVRVEDQLGWRVWLGLGTGARSGQTAIPGGLLPPGGRLVFWRASTPPRQGS